MGYQLNFGKPKSRGRSGATELREWFRSRGFAELNDRQYEKTWNGQHAGLFDILDPGESTIGLFRKFECEVSVRLPFGQSDDADSIMESLTVDLLKMCQQFHFEVVDPQSGQKPRAAVEFFAPRPGA